MVEGVTDETAFGLLLSRIIEEKKIVRFKIIGGDITTRTGTNAQNCIRRVVDQIKDFLESDFYRKSDLLEVIHLVDLDGAFVSKDCIIQNEGELKAGDHVHYTRESIVTDYIESICHRNEQKSEVLKKLCETKELYGKIPYQIYFFSCNLEDVFYNMANAEDDSKYRLAKQVVDRFIGQPSQFVQFMNSKDIALAGTYATTWEIVQQGTESLHRHSNFHIYLNQCIKE